MAVDVEGYDGFIIKEALTTVPNFLPSTIIFEQKIVKVWFPNLFDEIIELMHSKGYFTGCKQQQQQQTGSSSSSSNNNNNVTKFNCPSGDDLTVTLMNNSA